LTEALRKAAVLLLQDARLATRNVLRQRQRSGIALIAIAAGVVALVLAGGFIDWIYWSIRENTIGSRLGHIQVVRPGYFDSGAADPLEYLLPADAVARERIARLPGVEAVAPRLAVTGLVSHGNATLSFFGEGIDPTLEARFERFVLIASGQPLAASEPRGIIVGKGLADNLGLVVGDQVVLVTNRRSGGIHAVEVRVRGLFSSATKAYDDSALRMPIDVARELLGTKGANAWVVILDDTGRTDAVAAKIRDIVAGDRLEVVPWYRLADFYNKTVALFSKQMGVLKLIIAVIIILSISNTLMMSVLERTSEIGTMMALGTTRRTILRRFVGEGAVLGVVGGVIGVSTGVAAAFAISAIGIPMPPPPGVAHGFVGEIRATFPLVTDAFVLAVATTLLASFYPAWKASRMIIVDALRHAR
jgi:putative ABC transport system permease protein